MKNKKSYSWIIRLIILAFILLLGLGGFYTYYRALGGDAAVSRSVYSTIRLFGASFDLDYVKVESLDNAAIIIAVLETAKWLAIFMTGHIVLKLIRPFLSKIIIKTRMLVWKCRKNQVLIVGNNDQNLMIYRSVKKPDYAVVLVDSTDDCDSLSKRKIKAVVVNDVNSGDELTLLRNNEDWIKKTLERSVITGKKCSVIINTGSDEKNLRISKTAVEWMEDRLKDRKSRINDESISEADKMDDRRYIVSVLEKIRIYVFGDRDHQAVYLQIQKNSSGVLKYINKYQLVAFDFIEKYPLTEFIDSDTFSRFFDNTSVSPDFDFNVILLGFGETNREILTVSLANNQFTESNPGGIPRLKKVNYHIYDKDKSVFDRKTNHTLLRYEKEFLDSLESGDINKEDYFELSDMPANINYHNSDVNDPRFYKELKGICLKNKSSVNYVVVAVGGNLENMDVAQMISEKKKEWGIENLAVFAKTRDGVSEIIKESTPGGDYRIFGNEEKLVYSFSMIRRDELEELAIKRNLMYDYENSRIENSNVPYEDIEICAKCNWYVTMDNNKRASNFYSILSLRMKLQLLGLDCTRGEKPENTGECLNSNAEYFKIYAGDDNPTVAMPGFGENGKDVYSYRKMPEKTDFSGGARGNLTVQEHYRWNAYMISCGFIPQSIKETLENGSRNYLRRTHANLSTFEGLFDFRKAMAEHCECGEEEYDVVKYDYQLMDDAWWFLSSKGYKIYRRWQ